MLYGQRDIFDPVHEYAMSPAAAGKLVQCGYLNGHSPTRSPETVRRELDARGRPLVVVTAGGGGDGFNLLRTYLEAVAAGLIPPGVHSLVVTGPLMTRAKRDLLRGAVPSDRVTLLDFTPDLVSYIAAADLVVSMAGYNTVCETLSLGIRSLLVPRVRPRAEQRIRAERMVQRGLAHMLLPEDMTPASLACNVDAGLSAELPQAGLEFTGLALASQHIREML